MHVDLMRFIGGSGGGYSSSSYAETDRDWDWDYMPENRQWVCRGIQTGQFAEPHNCSFDLQNDDRWPG